MQGYESHEILESSQYVGLTKVKSLSSRVVLRVKSLFQREVTLRSTTAVSDVLVFNSTINNVLRTT